MEFNVVDAVAQHASFGDDRPTQPSFLVRIDDGLAGKSRSVRWVVVSNPHGELTFAGSRRNVGAEGRMTNEHLPVLTLGEVDAADERPTSLSFDPSFDVFGMSGLVDFSHANSNLPIVGRERVFFVAQARKLCEAVQNLQSVGPLQAIARQPWNSPRLLSLIHI